MPSSASGRSSGRLQSVSRLIPMHHHDSAVERARHRDGDEPPQEGRGGGGRVERQVKDEAATPCLLEPLTPARMASFNSPVNLFGTPRGRPGPGRSLVKEPEFAFLCLFLRANWDLELLEAFAFVHSDFQYSETVVSISSARELRGLLLLDDNQRRLIEPCNRQPAKQASLQCGKHG